MEDNELLRSNSQKSPCVTNVKKFVQDFEQRTPILREENGQGGSGKKMETMTKTSFRKLNELKKNLEQSMFQRYESNKNIHNVGKPISELKEALKKSVENLSSRSFTSQPYTTRSAVKLRHRASCDYINNSNDLLNSSNSRRSSLGSTKIKPIPLPKPKVSFKGKKYKSISDLCDMRESVIFEDIEFSGTNDVFRHSRGSGEGSRLSCDGHSYVKNHSQASPEYSKNDFNLSRSFTILQYPSQHSNDSLELSNRNSNSSQNVTSSTSTIKSSLSSSSLLSVDSNKRRSLVFEPIGETCTDDLYEGGSVLIKDDKNNEESKNLIEFEVIGETCTDEVENDTGNLHSTTDLKTAISFNGESICSDSSEYDDAIENGTYYISPQDHSNVVIGENLASYTPDDADDSVTIDTLAAETIFVGKDNYLNLTTDSSETPSPFIQPLQPSTEPPEQISAAFGEGKSPTISDSKHMEFNNQISTKKPCLMVSPLQSHQNTTSPRQQDGSSFQHPEQLTPFEAPKSPSHSPCISASHICNLPLCSQIHCYLLSVLTALSNTTQKDNVQVQNLSHLFTDPMSGFESISEAFLIQRCSPPPSSETLYARSKDDLTEMGECLIKLVHVLVAEHNSAVVDHQKNIPKLKEMVRGCVAEEGRDLCLRRVEELLVQVESVASLLFLLNRMLVQKQYAALSSIKNNTCDDALQNKLEEAKDLKLMMDQKYHSLLSCLANNSNQETCDFYINLIETILRLKFEKEFVAHKLFQLQRALCILSLSDTQFN